MTNEQQHRILYQQHRTVYTRQIEGYA